MPFLRVIRDKRGYETTYLMHWFQDNGRQRSRILYAFRTPSGTRVGRDALDPGLMRQLEATNPGIPFDWKAVLAERQVIEPTTEIRRRRPKRGDEARSAPACARCPGAGAEGRSTSSAARGGRCRRARWSPRQSKGSRPRTASPSCSTGIRWCGNGSNAATSDPDRHAALLSLAERMNPDGWPAEETEARLQQAGEALERLSHVFARRRRRARRRPAAKRPRQRRPRRPAGRGAARPTRL